MKKIVVIACVKNESDIIESYCRYNLSFCDAMLIYEAGKSSDGTRDIIRKLTDEGLPVYFEAEEADIYYEDVKRILAQIAADKYRADLTVQLDADEFLCCAGGANPRGVLENLQEDVEYQIPWRTYVYDEACETAQSNETDANTFLPSRFTKYRNPLFEQAQGHAGKALISRYLLREMNAKLTHGVHYLEYPGNTDSADMANKPGNAGKTPKIETSKELFIAHYPIRGKTQIINKTILNYINKWTLPEHLRTLKSQISDFQLGMLFDAIKEHGGIPPDIMRDISVKYSLFNPNADREKAANLLETLGDNLLITGTIDTEFCADKLTLRYTGVHYEDCKKAFLRKTLETIDKALQHLDGESRGKSQIIQEIHALRQHNDALKEQHILISQHRDSLIAKCDNLEEQLDAMRNSNAWKIGHRITRILGFFKRKKKN